MPWIGRDRALVAALKETSNICQNSKCLVQFGKTFEDKMHFCRALLCSVSGDDYLLIHVGIRIDCGWLLEMVFWRPLQLSQHSNCEDRGAVDPKVKVYNSKSLISTSFFGTEFFEMGYALGRPRSDDIIVQCPHWRRVENTATSGSGSLVRIVRLDQFERHRLNSIDLEYPKLDMEFLGIGASPNTTRTRRSW